MLAVIAYADLDRLMSRVDETRQLGLSHRVAIWRDTLAIIRDFPIAGVGSGNFANAMRVYQIGRPYLFLERGPQRVPADCRRGRAALRRPGGRRAGRPVPGRLAGAATEAGDHLRWMRVGAAASLVAVAIQSIWETGVTLPANGMLAAVAAAILVHRSRHAPDAPARD